VSECLTSQTPRVGLLGVDPPTLREWCERVGEPGYRAQQVLEWIYDRRVDRFDDMSNVPKWLRAALEESFRVHQSAVVAERQATDGTRKLLLEWSAGGRTECVLIPDGPRQTACISTQVGCPVGCVFCASGIGGLERNLSAAEIVEQAHRLAALAMPERLSNIVFMGLGEPLGNYQETVTAVRILNAEWGLNIGARKITISTVGLPSQMKRLADEQMQVTLALSLHAPTDELRQELIPWAKSISIAELVDAARYYFDQTGREVTLEYVLLGGVNDGQSHARTLARVAARMRCNVNLIRYNPVDGLPFRRPTSEAAAAFQSVLRDAGVNVHVRRSRGLDIDAACGQLRRRIEMTEQGDRDGTA